MRVEVGKEMMGVACRACDADLGDVADSMLELYAWLHEHLEQSPSCRPARIRFCIDVTLLPTEYEVRAASECQARNMVAAEVEKRGRALEE